MNSTKMFLSLIPWLVFSVLIHRLGFESAGLAALAAAGLGVVFIARSGESGTKLIDVVGVVMFGLLALACLAGGQPVSLWVADYGRGASALVLGAVMLLSVLAVPFTEQYAREGVPPRYWNSPTFHAVNRRISALWGIILLVMGTGHLVAGAVEPESAVVAGSGGRPIDFLLNWVLPVGLILLGVSLTRRIAAGAGAPGGEAVPDTAAAGPDRRR